VGAARERGGYTQLALAAAAKTSIQAISLAERGGPLTEAMARRLAAVLGVRLEDLRPEASFGMEGGGAPVDPAVDLRKRVAALTTST